MSITTFVDAIKQKLPRTRSSFSQAAQSELDSLGDALLDKKVRSALRKTLPDIFDFTKNNGVWQMPVKSCAKATVQAIGMEKVIETFTAKLAKS